jgi:hypothetical protein
VFVRCAENEAEMAVRRRAALVEAQPPAQGPLTTEESHASRIG